MKIYIYSITFKNLAEEGGGGKSTNITIKYLRKQGHHVFPFYSAKELKKKIKEEKPDLILHHNIVNMVKIYNISKKYKIPFIPTINGLFTCGKGTHILYSYYGIPCFKCSLTGIIRCTLKGHYKMPFPFFQLLKFLLTSPYRYYRIKRRINVLNKSAAVIAIGKTLKKILQTNNVKNKIYVVPQPIDDDILKKPKIKEKERIGEEEKKILFTNGFDTTKGILPLLDAFSELNRDDTELIITGRIYPIIKKIKPQKNVKILGEVSYEKLKKLYYSSDILAYPTLLFEPFGRAWAEGALTGLPIIAFKDRGGPADYPNYLVNLDKEELKKEINILLDNKKTKNKMNEISKKEFLADNVVKKLIKIYKEAK